MAYFYKGTKKGQQETQRGLEAVHKNHERLSNVLGENQGQEM